MYRPYPRLSDILPFIKKILGKRMSKRMDFCGWEGLIFGCYFGMLKGTLVNTDSIASAIFNVLKYGIIGAVICGIVGLFPIKYIDDLFVSPTIMECTIFQELGVPLQLQYLDSRP